jgi:D-alanine transaminase
MIAYLNGNYPDKNQIAVSPDDRGFLFADGIYEVVRIYSGRMFEMAAHLSRLTYGARELRFSPSEFGYLSAVGEHLIEKNRLEDSDALLYIQITRGVAPRRHCFPSPDVDLTVFAAVSAFQPDLEPAETGINVVTIPDQRWTRCDIKTVGLTANVMANQRAMENNAMEAIFVRDGVMVECSHSNLFAVREGRVITHPKTNLILGGITRRVVLDLCRRQSIRVEEQPILESHLDRMDEIFLTATTSEVTPVVRINGDPVNTGRPGPVTRKLQEAFSARVDTFRSAGLQQG